MTELPAENLPPETLPEVTKIRAVEDLTLLEMLQQLTRHPLDTMKGLSEVLSRRLPTADSAEAVYDAPIVVIERRKAKTMPLDASAVRVLAALGVVALIATLASFYLVTAPSDPQNGRLALGGPVLILAMAATAVIGIRRLTLPALAPLDLPAGHRITDIHDLIERYGIRLALAGMALLWTGATWLFNADNKFTFIGVVCWMLSILTWVGALLDRDVLVLDLPARILKRILAPLQQPISGRLTWTAVVLIVILLVGAWFRFSNLSAYPPDMTSDHVEKLLDTQRVLDGNPDLGGRSIFFPNNGGRESFQMYYLAVLKTITGMPLSFDLLKIGTGIEGMIMILVAWWMGRAIFGDEDRQLGNLAGLVMAALVATSFWGVLLSRLGLRIVTTTIVSGLLFIFFARALRYNRRSDYMIAGFILGAGMYCYQAVRMLPVVVIAGFILALLIRARSRRAIRTYTVNVICLIVISLAVFVPLAHYAEQYPDAFWQRTAARLFGDDIVRDQNTGKMIQLHLTLQDRLDAFAKNLPVLSDNMKKSLLMFNWKGDRSWFNGIPGGNPEMDFFAGALFVMGLGLIVARIIRRRDPVDWLLLISIPILLLSTALSIAYTIEVPSSTRASATFPVVYLIAALPLAVILQKVLKTFPPSRLRVGLIAIPVVLLIFGAMMNANSYFVDAMSEYRDSSLPHHQAGLALKGFIDSTGAPGNAFMIAYDYWWDNRALAIEAGDPTWHNTIPTHDDIRNQILNLIRINMGTKYELETDRQLMFFLNKDDTEAAGVLQQMFPNGSLISVPSYNSTRDFKLYITSPVGCDWALQQLGVLPASCQQQPAPSGAVPSPVPGPDNNQ